MQTDALRAAALAVLHMNDLGGWTKPAPRLYPHQWSWDSAFIAIGLAHVDVSRALRELETLFAAQWADGRVPHIVFNPRATDYFPGAGWWASASTSPVAPRIPATSGLIQPPVHALALLRILRTASLRPAGEAIVERVRELYPRVLAWHRYLSAARDPDGDGLLRIYHPWESGTDNSPRWDAPLSGVVVGDLPVYRRHDLQHVADPSERPTHAEYDRYLWLVELLKQAGYDDQRIQATHPFLVGDVLMSAIFACASLHLTEVAEMLSRPAGEIRELTRYAARFNAGVLRAWDPELKLALDMDVRAAERVRVETCAGLSPLLLAVEPVLYGQVVERLRGNGFAGAAGLAFPVVPSTTPGAAGFSPRTYWRGPAWPVVNWLLWYGLQRHGERDAANALRAANLAQLSQPNARFAEYFEPYTAAPLGSLEQSWTAAVALDWLAAEE